MQIVYHLSSELPIEYAILLQVRDAKGWETRIVVDTCARIAKRRVSHRADRPA